MRYAKILGTGSFLPSKVLTNQDLEKIVETSDEWIVSRTGIKERRVADEHESVASMGIEAGKVALESSGIDKNKIQLLVLATTAADRLCPSMAVKIQNELGLPVCIALDINAACSGFNYALNVVEQYIKSGTVDYALLIASEAMTRLVDWNDRSTCVLFGDGAGAIVLGASDKPGIHTTIVGADGQYESLLYVQTSPVESGKGVQNSVQMQGNEVFKLAVIKLGQLVSETLEKCGMTQNDVDWLIPHQANLRIIQAVAKRLELKNEQVIITLDKQGNTSAASIPIALDIAIRDGRIKRGDVLLFESFGAGFVWGSALVTY
ncbi:MAG: beta-ketoacyl-ACP synthase III [Gammaproteobacteria bacterium]